MVINNFLKLESNINKSITIQEILKRSLINPKIIFNNSISWKILETENNNNNQNQKGNEQKVSCLKSICIIDNKFREGNMQILNEIVNYEKNGNKLDNISVKPKQTSKNSNEMLEEIINEFFN